MSAHKIAAKHHKVCETWRFIFTDKGFIWVWLWLLQFGDSHQVTSSGDANDRKYSSLQPL